MLTRACHQHNEFTGAVQRKARAALAEDAAAGGSDVLVLVAAHISGSWQGFRGLNNCVMLVLSGAPGLGVQRRAWASTVEGVTGDRGLQRVLNVLCR